MAFSFSSIFKTVIAPTVKSLASKVVPILAGEAVEFVEKNLQGTASVAKKQAAMDFVLNKLPIPLVLKPFQSLIEAQLMNVVDQAIEQALVVLKSKI